MNKIELLNRSHNRKGFDCGNLALNHFLQRIARQHIEKGISRTFVMVDGKEPSDITGFLTLSLCEVDANALPARWVNKYSSIIPGVRLARLAVITGHQGQGIGKILLIEAMRRASLVAENVGVVCLFVDAKDLSARAYYQRFGFETAEKFPLLLFLPLSGFLELK